MNKFILTLLLSLGCLQGALAANVRLVGTWHSVDAKHGALPGVIELHQDGTAKLAPEGQTVLEGTWVDNTPTTVTFDMPPHGKAVMTYRFQKSQLVLRYDDGSEQRFSKVGKKK